MNDDFEDISIEDIFKKIKINHKKQRKSKEERERENAIDKIERENYKSLMMNRFSTLEGLRDEVYTLIYNYDILNFKSNLKALNEIYENKDLGTLEKIVNEGKELLKLYKDNLKQQNEINEKEDFETIKKLTYKTFEPIKIYQYKQAIINFLEVNNIEIQIILNEIKTSDESERVHQALISSEHITLLPKSYSIVKKDKVKAKRKKLKKKTKYISIPTTYQQALRRNRHFLEEDLKEIGVGQQRAERISSLLKYL